jgi:hypothetical protein
MRDFFKRVWALVRDPVGFTSNVAFVGGVFAIAMHACSRQVVEEAHAQQPPEPPHNALCATYPPDAEYLGTIVYSGYKNRACFRVGNEVQCWELFRCKR